MQITGKSREIEVLGRKLLFFNQSSPDWTHPYPWEGHGNLHNSGCGIFSLCHVAEWLTGKRQSPEFWADFSVANGGRGDDGTDRPALLHALEATGKARELGFCYFNDGLRNDQETLWQLIHEENGAAFCNLRVGHIVTLISSRIQDNVRQYLVIDSASETDSERIRDNLTEMVAGTEINKNIINQNGLKTAEKTTFAAYWVRADVPKDFNLLHRC